MTCHVGVLPEDILQILSAQVLESGDGALHDSHSLRFLRLPHPRTGITTLFLPYELRDGGKSSVLEVQAVSPPNARSWFMPGEVVQDGKLLVMTPIDPVFLLIPILSTTQPADGLGNFRPLDDTFEDAANKLVSTATEGSGSTLSDDLAYLSSLRCVQVAMRRICEFKEITTDIVVYRFSPDYVQNYLRSKVARLSGQRVAETSRTITRSLARDGLFEDGKDELLTAGRLRCACDLLSQYLAKDVYAQLLSSYDFTALDAYMKVLKEEAMALSAAKMNAVEAKESRDAGMDKKETGADKKRKARGSTGTEKLKKANVKGMAKLSTFFQKK